MLVGYSTHVNYFFGKVMDAMPSCVGDAMSSVVDYRVQEFLVDRLFAFFNVLTIFFGLCVDAGIMAWQCPC